ncbi:OLC1v1034999C1 [Oldenlandia corymbosa var. corymbosa]|uniref:OLC1v1034999C1 n=1 Tax=Oldenlandia corymbosa var. corymbosa TaxID=529605 RepID=A0AAV1CV36_OLDCO|nr:OLC1v1034999C1 [Oldenlandia corymbosa var. corymbosa]
MIVELKQGLLRWNPYSFPLVLSPPAISHKPNSLKIYAVVESMNGSIERNHHEGLTAKEKRQLRNSRRESKASNWKEEVEERFIKKPKKQHVSWTEELNLDKLALLGPQWWVVRVSRMAGPDTYERLARLLAKKFPTMDFKVYVPSVQVKKKLKNGTLSVKPKSVFPGCVFLRCVLNKDVHDFVRDEIDGIGGFVGAKVGNTKRQINKPRPVDSEDMEAIYERVKHEQDEADRAFLEEQGQESSDSEKLNVDTNSASSSSVESESNTPVKARGRRKKATASGDQLVGSEFKLPKPGSTVQVVSGAFAGFSGILKKFDINTGLVTVSLTLFGKETLADLKVNEITAGPEAQ